MRSVVSGSNFVLCVDVYSDTLRNPKNAVSMAAQSKVLSSYKRCDLNRFSLIVWRMLGVMGRRFGRDREDPCDLLIPLIRR